MTKDQALSVWTELQFLGYKPRVDQFGDNEDNYCVTVISATTKRRACEECGVNDAVIGSATCDSCDAAAEEAEAEDEDG